MDVSTVAVKLPTFWPAQLATWFIQAEAQFALRGITTDSTKYYHVIAALDQDTALRITDVIQNPPQDGKYDALKKRLFQTLELQESEHAERLLNLASTGLGDRMPTQLMEEMLQLLGTKPFCFLCKQIFLRQLPVVVRTQLVNDNFKDLRAAALTATNLWQATQLDRNLLSSATQPSQSVHHTAQPDKPNHSKTGLCFYHQRFGKTAQRCTKPCTFSGNAQAGHQAQ